MGFFWALPYELTCFMCKHVRTYVLGFSFLHVYLHKLILDCVSNSATLPSGHTSNPNNEIAAIVLLFAHLLFFFAGDLPRHRHRRRPVGGRLAHRGIRRDLPEPRQGGQVSLLFKTVFFFKKKISTISQILIILQASRKVKGSGEGSKKTRVDQTFPFYSK